MNAGARLAAFAAALAVIGGGAAAVGGATGASPPVTASGQSHSTQPHQGATP